MEKEPGSQDFVEPKSNLEELVDACRGTLSEKDCAELLKIEDIDVALDNAVTMLFQLYGVQKVNLFTTDLFTPQEIIKNIIEILKKEPEKPTYPRDLPTDDGSEGHFLDLGPGAKIENLEKREQFGVRLETAEWGERRFATGTLGKDEKGQPFQVIAIEFQEITDEAEIAKITAHGKEKGIVAQKKLADPMVTIQYADGSFRKTKKKLLASYYDKKAEIKEGEDFYEDTHLELRSHDFKLGELVSFGDRFGKLAMIASGDQIQFGVVAETSSASKDRTAYLWLVDANLVDYIVHNEKGAIKRYPDHTLFKPTLGNPDFPEFDEK